MDVPVRFSDQHPHTQRACSLENAADSVMCVVNTVL